MKFASAPRALFNVTLLTLLFVPSTLSSPTFYRNETTTESSTSSSSFVSSSSSSRTETTSHFVSGSGADPGDGGFVPPANPVLGLGGLAAEPVLGGPTTEPGPVSSSATPGSVIPGPSADSVDSRPAANPVPASPISQPGNTVTAAPVDNPLTSLNATTPTDLASPATLSPDANPESITSTPLDTYGPAPPNDTHDSPPLTPNTDSPVSTIPADTHTPVEPAVAPAAAQEPFAPSSSSSSSDVPASVPQSPEPVVSAETPESSSPTSSEPEPAAPSSPTTEPPSPAAAPEPAATSTSCPAVDPPSNSTPPVDADWARRNDIQLLNFILTLSHLSSSLYASTLSRYNATAFANIPSHDPARLHEDQGYNPNENSAKGYEPWVRGRFEQILEREEVHVRFLEEAVEASGGEGVGRCVYNFPDQDPHEAIELSEAVSTLMVSALTGALKHIESKEYASAIGSMLGVEARVSAWINSAVKKQNPWNLAFETPLALSQSHSIAQNFISSCPPSNTALLPPALQTFPPLILPSRIEAGVEIEVTFDERRLVNRKELFSAFMLGTGTYLLPVRVVEERVPHPINMGAGRGAQGERSGSGSGIQKDMVSGGDPSSSSSQEGGEGSVKRRFYITPPVEVEGTGVVYITIVQADGGIGEGDADVDVDVAKAISDENTVAGPGVVVFPFNSRGEPWGRE